jgi:ABC-type uncharacterized transport system ATPase subunit
MRILKVPETATHPKFEQDIGRVNVILGANGAGKSSLLRDFRNQGAPAKAFGVAELRLIDGARLLRPQGSSMVSRHLVADGPIRLASELLFEGSEDTAKQHAQMLLEVLCADHRAKMQSHSNQCLELAKDGKPAVVPERTESLLDRFKRLFEETFPLIQLNFEAEKVTLACMRKGAQYSPDRFSSGERQVFLLLGKFIMDQKASLFLVDEPEQNLSAKLADRFWSIIERFRPESVFIYSTHALHFAVRPGVEKIFVLSTTDVINVTSALTILEDMTPSARQDSRLLPGKRLSPSGRSHGPRQCRQCPHWRGLTLHAHPAFRR